jgi:hypothetical protein
MLELYSLVVTTDGRLAAPLHVANDGPPLTGVAVRAALAGNEVTVEVGDLAGWRAVAAGTVELQAPPEPGAYELSLRLVAAGREVAANTYPVRVVAATPVDDPGHPAPWSATLPHRGAWARARRG